MPSSLEDYEVLHVIGCGSYGICKKVKRKKDGKLLVWKQLDYGCMSEAEKQLLVSEVNLLRELKHQNIVRYYDRIIDRVNTSLYIIMEYCQGGDLSSVIRKAKKEKKQLEENFIWKIFAQVVLALKVCHKRNGGQAVLHRDLKPANVFLDSSQNVKLGDFGLARVLHHETSFAKTFVGTPYYMSPEQMNYMQYNEKSDIWSLGCLIYELCALHPPFVANNQKDLAVRIRAARFARIPPIYSDDLQEVISKMLTVEEDRRPSTEDLAKHKEVLRFLPREKCSGSTGSTDSGKAAFESEAEVKLRNWEDTLRERESAIEQKEKDLIERQKRLDAKEQNIQKLMRRLELKEKADLRTKRAEFIPQQIGTKITPKAAVAPSSGSPFYEILPQSCLNGKKNELSPKKKVHFDENNRAVLNYRNVNPVDLKARLQKAKFRAKELQTLEIEAKKKSRQLLGIR